MDLLTIGLAGIAVLIGLLIISALPLYFAVKILGGEASVFKVLFVNLIAGIVGIVVNSHLVTFLLLIFVYKLMFRLSWIAAFFAWMLQFVIALLLVGIAIMLDFGIAIV